MTVTARATKSIRVRDVLGQRSSAIGFANLVFADQATGGESTLDLTALTVPTGYGALGFVQPTLSQIQSADVKAYRKNLKLKSSIKGWLSDYEDYVVTSPTLITFQGFVMQAGEVITGYLDKAPMPGLIAVDNVARPMNGTLSAGVTIFNVGWPFEVNKFPTAQIGAILVIIDGMVQMRCVGNTVAGNGNYVENLAATGLGNTITFKDAPFAEDREIMVVPIMGAAVAPNGSTVAMIESVNARIEVMIPDLATATGNPESKYNAGPSSVDLAAFGTRVTRLDTALVKSANYTANVGEQILGDTSGGAWTLTMPAAPTPGQRVSVLDAKKTFSTSNLTVGRNGKPIEGVAQDYLCDVDGLKVEFYYVDDTYGWSVYRLVP